MRCQSGLFEIRLGAIDNIKRFGGALFSLFLLMLSAAAQSNDVSKVNNDLQSATKTESRNQTDSAKPLTLQQAVNLALKQVSNYQNARISEQIAVQDVKQAKLAFLPRVAVNPSVILTSPSLGNSVSPRPPSFIGANAITEYQGLVTAAGEIDFSGKLKATLKRNQALVESARLGGEIVKLDLINNVSEAYFNLALATVRRRGAEMNAEAALEFEKNIKLQLEAGEIAPVDSVRARLQTSQRSDELEQARANESAAADSLRVLIGYDFTSPISTEDLLVQIPNEGEIDRFAAAMTANRLELTQFEADKTAAEQDIKIAKSERRPQITYSVSGGFVSDTLAPMRLKNNLGVQAAIGVSIPLFDAGASRSREMQAKLRFQQAENNKNIAERQFAQAFFTARTQAVSAASRIKRLAATIADAEQNVAASTARYRAGESSIIEVTDAQNTLVLQRQALYQAIFDYQTARTKLLRAIGQ